MQETTVSILKIVAAGIIVWAAVINANAFLTRGSMRIMIVKSGIGTLIAGLGIWFGSSLGVPTLRLSLSWVLMIVVVMFVIVIEQTPKSTDNHIETK